MAAAASPYGRFVGDVRATWIVDREGPDRTMKLDADFAYVDPDGVSWPAPKGRDIDGASIPSLFWGPLIGSPYTGDFRRASVVHDIACQDRPRTSDEAHRMFYYAMLCDGTDRWLAETMYAAVKTFGPQWGVAREALPMTAENVAQFQRMVLAPAAHPSIAARALEGLPAISAEADLRVLDARVEAFVMQQSAPRPRRRRPR
jgi:hypothetical protein